MILPTLADVVELAKNGTLLEALFSDRKCRDVFKGRRMRQATVTRWFNPKFAASQPGEVERLLDSLVNTSPQGYAANCAAVRDADFTHQLAAVQLPVMVIRADQDLVTNVADGELLKQAITGAQLVTLCAAHLSNVEAGQSFSLAVLAFLMSRA